jgi:hypothetical protein
MRYCEFAGQCFRPDRTKFLKEKRKELIQIKIAEREALAEEKDGSDQPDSVQERT